MKTLLKIIAGMLLLFVTVATQLTFSYLLPHPLDTTNVILAVVTLAMLLKPTGYIVWLSFFLHYLVELYALTPFGIILFSGTMSTLLAYWLLRDVFSTPNIPTVFGTIAMTLLMYRIFFVGGVYLVQILTGQNIISLNLQLFSRLGWEFLFTVLSATLVYTCMRLYTTFAQKKK